jgi:hypothetical protein
MPVTVHPQGMVSPQGMVFPLDMACFRDMGRRWNMVMFNGSVLPNPYVFGWYRWQHCRSPWERHPIILRGESSDRNSISRHSQRWQVPVFHEVTFTRPVLWTLKELFTYGSLLMDRELSTRQDWWMPMEKFMHGFL